MKKQILYAFLTVILCLTTVFSLAACDDKNTTPGGGTTDAPNGSVADGGDDGTTTPDGDASKLEYKLNEDGSGYIVYGLLEQYQNETTVVIPDTYNDLPVTEIHRIAFSNCEHITSITIGQNVTRINEAAFNNCTGLTSITIPDSVTSIEPSVFEDCTGLVSATIGTGLTNYDYGSLFPGCTNLSSVVISDGVTSIADYMFSNCTGLTSITIPNSVTSIGEGAFASCTSLTDITIPKSVTVIGPGAFEYCENLTIHIEIGSPLDPDTAGSWISQEYTLEWVKPSDWTVADCLRYELNADGTAYTVSMDGRFVEFIGTDLVIPSAYNDLPVTAIGENGFYGFTALESITIPDSVTSIGGSAFYGCTSLTSVSMGNGVTVIGRSAFFNCESLTDITIPDSVTVIQNLAFRGCSSLTSIAIPNGVTVIEDYLFYCCTKLTDVTIPSGVTEIGEHAFDICSSLTSIIIPESVIHIGEYAFKECRALTEVVLSDNLTSIEEGTFYHCNKLTGIIIPEGVTVIGENAFDACESMTSITLPATMESIGDSAFIYCRGLTNVVIPVGLTSIGNGVFSGCVGLTDVTIPDSVETIGFDAFSGCSGLTSIIIPDGVTSIGEEAFYGCVNLEKATLGANLSSVGENAFANCSNLVEVMVKNENLSFPASTFTGTHESFQITEYYEILEYQNGYYQIANQKTTFIGMIDQTAEYIILKDGTTHIVENALDGCSNLRFIYIPDSYVAIGQNAFTCDLPRYFTVFCEGWLSSSTYYGSFEFEQGENESMKAPYFVVEHANISEDGYIYTIASSEATIWGYMGNESDVAVPSSIDGYSVTTVAGHTFAGTKVQSVTLPGTLTALGGYTSVEVEITDENGDTLSYGNIIYTHGPFQKSMVKTVTFADPATAQQMLINAFAFGEAEFLETVTFPTICEFGYYGETPYLSKGVYLTVMTHVFQDCPSLQTVTLSPFTALYNNVFDGTTTLENVILTDNGMSEVNDNICDIVISDASFIVNSRTAIDVAITESSTALATYILENSDKYFEFGSKMFGG